MEHWDNLALAGTGPARVRHADTLSHSHGSHQENDALIPQVGPLTCSSSLETSMRGHSAGPAQISDTENCCDGSGSLLTF